MQLIKLGGVVAFPLKLYISYAKQRPIGNFFNKALIIDQGRRFKMAKKVKKIKKAATRELKK